MSLRAREVRRSPVRAFFASCDVLEPRRLLSGSPVSINFQPSGAAVPSGYFADTGAVYGNRGNGYQYGWDQSITSGTRDRNSSLSADQRYDTLVHTQLYGTRTWELGVANGTFRVHLVAGDPTAIDSVYKFSVENTPALTGTPSSAVHWIESTTDVTVSDGRLTISNASGSSNNKICYVDVTPLDQPPPVNQAPSVALTAPLEGSNFPAGSDIAINANASDGDGNVTSVEFFNGGTKLGESTAAPYGIAWTNVGSGSYTLTAVAHDNGGAATTSAPVHIKVGASAAYGGVEPTLPGTVQAENFDEGASGSAYFDTTTGNSGNVYRTGDVDITAATDTGGGYAVGWTRAREWLNYSVNVPAAGTYNLDVRVASGSAGGTFHVEFGNYKTSSITLANTGGWQTWKTLTKTGIALPAGHQIMRLVFDSAASASDIGNVNWLRLSDPAAPTVSVTASDASAAEAGPDTGKFTITRSGSFAAPLTVRFTAGGTAGDGIDDDSIGTSVTIPAGSASALVLVTPRTDGIAEGNETVVLALANDPAYTIGSWAQATVTIRDADVRWPTSWRKVAPAPLGRWESSAIAMNGKIYLFGGWIQGSTVPTKQVDVYDVASNTWKTLPDPMPIPDTHAAVIDDPASNVLYFAGGFYGNYPGAMTNTAWKFDATTETWSSLPSMPAPAAAGGFALLDGKLHYFSGSAGEASSVNLTEHYILDVANNATSWTTAAAPLTSPRDHFATVVLGGKIYAIGGEFGHDKLHQQTNLVHVYDPTTDAWTRVADMPVRKSHAEASTFVLDGRILSAGGMVDNFASTDTVALYEPQTDKWLTLSPLPGKLQGTVVQQVGNQIFITTGNNGDKVGQTTTWVGDLV